MTHAVEGYVSRTGARTRTRSSLQALRMIRDNLERAVEDAGATRWRAGTC